MASVLEGVLPKSRVLLYVFLDKRIFMNKCFLFTVGSVCRVKLFTTGSRFPLKDVRKSLMMLDPVETEVRKWLREQSKDELVKRWGKCINVSGG
jgi:hypothetical protein